MDFSFFSADAIEAKASIPITDVVSSFICLFCCGIVCWFSVVLQVSVPSEARDLSATTAMD